MEEEGSLVCRIRNAPCSRSERRESSQPACWPGGAAPRSAVGALGCAPEAGAGSEGNEANTSPSLFTHETVHLCDRCPCPVLPGPVLFRPDEKHISPALALAAFTTNSKTKRLLVPYWQKVPGAASGRGGGRGGPHGAHNDGEGCVRSSLAADTCRILGLVFVVGRQSLARCRVPLRCVC